LLLAVWIAFLARGAFSSAAVPIWEGFDEWAHFAVVERMVQRGEILVWRQSLISREIEASLELAPVPWELRHLPPPCLTEDAYWRLTAAERARREQLFYSLPRAWSREDARGGGVAYEALQPPLYYWIAKPVLFLTRQLDLGARVVVLRWFSVALASLVIPLSFLVTRIVFLSERLGLLCAALIAAMPEFLVDVARVGNDSLGAVWWTLLTWLVLKAVCDGMTRRRTLFIGAVLGLGLITKAYFLAAIPPIALLFFGMRVFRCLKFRKILTHLALVYAPAIAIAGWWYVRNIVQTGTLSGLSESVMVRGRLSTLGILSRAGKVNWLSAIDSILFSHIWFGGWSSLTVRSWMYHFFYLFILVAGVGIVTRLRQPTVAALSLLYLGFWLGQLYNVLLLFAAKGVATSMGWYMYAVVAAEVGLFISGLAAVAPVHLRRYLPLAAICVCVLLDLYTTHAVAVPYYTGVITHRSNGSLEAVHVAEVSGIGLHHVLLRLTAFKSGILNQWSMLGLWVAYLLGTGSLVLVGLCCSVKGRRAVTMENRPNAAIEVIT
jgi:hypothetical protein